MPVDPNSMAARLLPWYADNGRHHLPWRHTVDAYALWLAEIMLQQTRVETALDYYPRFLEKFPGWESLASANLDDVLALWSGLGYYARARNAHRTAKLVAADWNGLFPDTLEEAMLLPGVGRSTAAAVLDSAYGQSQAILDANARRVLLRVHGLQGNPRAPAQEKTLWRLAEQETPDPAHEYNQAIQDLGSLVCLSKRPRCTNCPLMGVCRGSPAVTGEASPQVSGGSGKRPRPKRFGLFLLALDGSGKVFLERRPEQGVWGGLWCLPLVYEETSLPGPEDLAEGAALAASRFGAVLRAGEILSFRQHVFSHFILEFATLPAFLPAMQQVPDALSHGQLWAPGDALGLGLPSPIRRILEELC